MSSVAATIARAEFDSDAVIDRASACLGEMDGIAVAYEQEFSEKNGKFLPPGDLPLESRVRDFVLKSPRLLRGFFRHQYDGIAQILRGRHTVVSTPTSSGKSLIFGVPVFDALARDPKSTALLIYPQKALANDQLGKLKHMASEILASSVSQHAISRYDGSTPVDLRPLIRQQGRVVLTNPDMLHLAILQFHDKWARFFTNLKYVVIDEAHDYRGIFGSSVAYVFRRLRAIAKRYGSEPTFISASATIDQPTEHLKKLTGLEFEEIGSDLDGSIQGRKKLWLLKSDGHYYKLGRDLTMNLVDRGLSCLTFCPSRVAAERLLDDLPESVRRDDRIRVYRAGLNSAEREDVERGLGDGSIKAVFCTSALELGIDIGSLDAVVCVGLPNTMMSLWQRAGRVGRAGKDGAIFFITADTPLDSYYTEHPEELFGRNHEPLAVNLQNRRLVCHHLACAIDEAGDEKLLDVETLGPEAKHALDLRQAGRLNHEVFYSSDKHAQTPIRSSDAQNYKLMIGDESIGEIDQWHLLREAYPKAIYLHGGRRYRVQDIFRSKREVRLNPERSFNRTVPLIHKSVRTRRVRSVSEYPGIVVTEADLEVTERLIAINEKKPDGATVGQYEGSQGLPPHRLPTEGICIEITAPLLTTLDAMIKSAPPTAVYAAIERLIGGLFPVILGPCDTMDYSTFSERRDNAVVIYLYDQVPDGIDLSVQAYGRVGQLFEKAYERVQSCDCITDEGCFRCIRNPTEEDAIDKETCLRVLERIDQVLKTSRPVTRTFSIDVLEEQVDAVGECPSCKGRVRGDDRFCPSCGERLKGTL
jgi:DEAD/DEAH box helicase domain-containing protein